MQAINNLWLKAKLWWAIKVHGIEEIEFRLASISERIEYPEAGKTVYHFRNGGTALYEEEKTNDDQKAN